MDSYSPFSVSPRFLLRSVWENRQLIAQLTSREIIGRYRGSVLGVFWSFVTPVFMLAIYTFVFSVVFKARWGLAGGESKAEFALLLFAGLIVFNLFSECLTRAPSLILSHATYVKKVVFPLEILPWVSMGSALFHAAISLLVWLIAYGVFYGHPHVSVLLLPVVLFPFVLLVMGLSWFLASLGVYLRDISNLIGTLLTVLMFLSPIFYPVSALPEKYRVYLYLNPLTPVVEQVRNILYWGGGVNWAAYVLYALMSLAVALMGFVWFQNTRRGFADVL